MKLRVTAGACILAAIVTAGMWDLQRSSAQVAGSSTAAPAPSPSPLLPATAEASISPPGQQTPPPIEVPGLSRGQTKFFTFEDSGPRQVNAVYGGIGDKVIHLTTKGGNRQAADALRQAAAALRDAKDDAAKTAAQGQLTELLDKVFEEDMQRREQELAQVEQRTKDLRALMGRRREKKNEIVELQIKVLLNEADGLGFFNESPTPVPNKTVEVRQLLGNALNSLAPQAQSISTTSSDSALSPPPATTLPGAVAPAR
jgi:hypothetical protein